MSGNIQIKTTLKRDSLKTFTDLKQFKKASRRVIRQFWFLSGHDFRNEARAEIIRKPKSGRTYHLRKGFKSGARKGQGRRVRHVASAPFETHANFTGQTRDSIGFKLVGQTRMEFGYGVATGKPATEWAPYLEFGTIGFKKIGPMAARPSLNSAIDKMEGKAPANFDEALRREFKF